MSIEQINKKDIWNPYFYNAFAGFASILPMWHLLQQIMQSENWPSIAAYNLLAKSCFSKHSPDYHVAFQKQEPDMRYETHVNLKRIVPTRPCSWHDFFNNLSWVSWPKMKSAIVKRTCQEMDSHQSNIRTPLQNTLAHFDECGVVICSTQPEIFEFITSFEWKKLFWETKNLTSICMPMIVGHGLLEKALQPYVGMTAKAIFMHVEKDFLRLDTQSQNEIIDTHISEVILSPLFPTSPKALQPFPILGWPKWHHENANENFYHNTAYFRSGRQTKEIR